MEEQFKVGQTVQLTNPSNLDQIGTIRYIGPVEGMKNQYYGIELKEPKGNHDGVVKGKRYFQCKNPYGLMTVEKHLKAYVPKATKPSISGVKRDSTLKTGTGVGVTKPTTSTSSSNSLAKPKTSPSSNVQAQKVQELEAQIQNKDIELQQQKEILEKTQEMTQNLTQELENVSINSDELKKQVKLQESQIQSVQQQNEQLTGQLEQVKNQNNDMQNQLQNFQGDENDEEIQKVIKLSKQVLEKDNEILELNSQLKAQKHEFQQEQISIKGESEQLKNIVVQKNSEIQKLQKQMTDLSQNQQQQLQNTNSQQTDSLQTEIKAKNKKIQEMESKIEQLEQEKEEESQNIEMLTIELEEIKLTIEEFELKAQNAEEETKLIQEQLDKRILEDQEKQQNLEEAMNNLESGQGDDNKDQSELKIINVKLTQEIKTLKDRLEEQEIDFMDKEIMLEEKIEDLKDLNKGANETSSELKELQETLKMKEYDIEQLKIQIDESADAVQMVELLNEEKFELEIQISELNREMKEMREEAEVNQELIDTQEEAEKENIKEINRKDYEIYTLEQQIKSVQENLDDSNNLIQKYKEKMLTTQTQYQLVQDQLNSTLQDTNVNENLQKQQQLVQDYQDLLLEKRDIYKKYIQSKQQTIKYLMEDISKTNLYQEAIPQNVISKLQPQGFLVYSQTRKIKEMCILCMKEFQKLLGQSKMVKEDNILLSEWIVKLLKSCSQFLGVLIIYEHLIYEEKDEAKILNLIESPIKTLVIQGGQFIEQILRNLIEDSISSSIQLDQFDSIILKIKENEESLEIDNQNITWNTQMLVKSQSISYQISKHFFDLKYKKQDHDIDFLFNAFNKRIIEFNENLIQGSDLPKQKETIQKLINQIYDTVNSVDSTNLQIYFLNGQNQGLSLQNQIDQEEEGEKQQQEQQEIEKLQEEVVEFRNKIKDLTNILNSINSQTTQELQFQHKDENPKYWKGQAQNICQEIKDVDKSLSDKQKLEKKMNEIQIQLVQTEKDKNNFEISLKKKDKDIVQLEIKSNRVDSLQSESEILKKKEKDYQRAGETMKKELEKQRLAYRQLKEQLDDLRETGMIPGDMMTGNNNNNNNGQASQRQSVRAQNSLLGRGIQGIIAQNNSNQPNGIQQIREENGMLLKYFRKENCNFRQQEMKNKIQKLKKESPMLALYRKKKNLKAAPSTESDNTKDKNDLQNAIIKINNVHNSVLNSYVSEQIVNLEEINRKYENLEIKSKYVNGFIVNENRDLQALKIQAYDVCNSILKMTSKNKENYTVRNPIKMEQNRNEQLKTKKLALFDFGSQQENSQENESLKISVNREEWKQIKVLL